MCVILKNSHLIYNLLVLKVSVSYIPPSFGGDERKRYVLTYHIHFNWNNWWLNHATTCTLNNIRCLRMRAIPSSTVNNCSPFVMVIHVCLYTWVRILRNTMNVVRFTNTTNKWDRNYYKTNQIKDATPSLVIELVCLQTFFASIACLQTYRKKSQKITEKCQKVQAHVHAFLGVKQLIFPGVWLSKGWRLSEPWVDSGWWWLWHSSDWCRMNWSGAVVVVVDVAKGCATKNLICFIGFI